MTDQAREQVGLGAATKAPGAGSRALGLGVTPGRFMGEWLLGTVTLGAGAGAQAGGRAGAGAAWGAAGAGAVAGARGGSRARRRAWGGVFL